MLEIFETITRLVVEPLQTVLEEPTFTNFFKLAMELRLMIWQHALPEPRLIIVKAMGQRVEAGFTPGSSGHFDSGQKTVALTQVNKEARTETLRHYRLSFREQFNGNAVYFDFTRDALLMTLSEIFHYFFDRGDDVFRFHDEPRYCFENLQHLVVADWVWRTRRDLLERFCKLEDYTALCGDNTRMDPAMFPLSIGDAQQHLRDSWPRVARGRGQSDFLLPLVEESLLGIEEFTKNFRAKHTAN